MRKRLAAIISVWQLLGIKSIGLRDACGEAREPSADLYTHFEESDHDTDSPLAQQNALMYNQGGLTEEAQWPGGEDD